MIQTILCLVDHIMKSHMRSTIFTIGIVLCDSNHIMPCRPYYEKPYEVYNIHYWSRIMRFKPYYALQTIDDSVDGDAAIIINDANFRWEAPLADIPKTPASSRDPISPSTSTTTSQGEIKYRAVANNDAVDEKSNKLTDVAVKLDAGIYMYIY